MGGNIWLNYRYGIYLIYSAAEFDIIEAVKVEKENFHAQLFYKYS